MAKCIFHPNIQGYSGDIINKNHSFRTRYKHVGGMTVGGLVRRKGIRAYTIDPNTGLPMINIKKYNLQRAFILLATVYWPQLTADTVAYATWDNAAKTLSMTLDYDISAYQLFIGYFQQKYVAELGTSVYPNSLSNGTSLQYDDRATRIWS